MQLGKVRVAQQLVKAREVPDGGARRNRHGQWAPRVSGGARHRDRCWLPCVKRCLVAPRRWWSMGVISQGGASPRFAGRCAHNLVRKTPGPADKAWVKNPGQHAGTMAVRLPDWMAWCWCTAGELVRSHLGVAWAAW